MTNPMGRLSHVMRHLTEPVTAASVIKYPTRTLTSGSQSPVLETRKTQKVLNSHISYLDTGKDSDERVVVFLHGNPTCAYLWRNVIPHVQPVARCIAPDLIGMGKSGKEPNNSYTFADHYRYLSAWLDSMKLPQKITFVVHDWGGGLGFHWCHQHKDRVKAIAYTETIVRTIPNWDFFPDVARNVFKAMRSEAGEEMVLKKNLFVERLFPRSILRQLEPEEMNVYREPYTEVGESRRPTLTWPREIPIESDGPQYVVDLVKAYNAWLRVDSNVPKLFIDAEPGLFSPGIRQAVKQWPNQRTITVKGSHFVQEDSPDEIGLAVARLVKEVYCL